MPRIRAAEIDDREQVEKNLERALSFLAVGFFHPGPKLRRHETRNRRLVPGWKRIERREATEDMDAGARIEHKRGRHTRGAPLPLQNGPFVLLRSWRWIRKRGGVGIFLGEIARHIPEGEEFRMRAGSGPKNHGVVTLLDQNLRAFEAVFLRETDGLAAAVLEDFSGHIYRM